MHGIQRVHKHLPYFVLELGQLRGTAWVYLMSHPRLDEHAALCLSRAEHDCTSDNLAGVDHAFLGNRYDFRA